MSVRPHGTTRFPLYGFSLNLIFEYFSKSVEKIQASLKSGKNDGYSYMKSIVHNHKPRSILLTMRNVSDKNYRENLNTHSMFNNFFFESHAVYEIMWKIFVEPERSQMTICWITQTKNTHSEYVILTAAVVAQACLNVTLYVHCLSFIN